MTFDFSAPLKSFDHRLFVREFAVFYTRLYSIIISWYVIGTDTKETVSETIRKAQLQLSVISLGKL